MITGYHDTTYTGRAATPAACCLDNDSAVDAFAAELVFVRVYENKTQPDPEAYAAAGVSFALERRRDGQRVVLVGGNEPNLSFENWQTDPAGYASWFAAWSAEVKARAPDLECWWAGMSPGVDPLAWYAGCEAADGVVLHAYGLSVDELMGGVRAFVQAHPGQPWAITETNHGVGSDRVCDRDQWADGVLQPCLQECAALDADAVCYFVFDGWEQDDASVGQATPPIAKDTRIDAVIREWVALPPVAGGNGQEEIAAIRDQVWALADRAEQLGWPWYGQSLKSATSLSKSER